MPARGRALIREHWLVFAALCGVAFAPVVVLILHVARHGGVLTGVNGGDYFDQFQYLAWIRDEGSHGLASNLWVTGATPHDYLQPMYLISGVLWRLGLSLQLAYLIWKPVALLVMFLGFAAYVGHMVRGGRGARAAALALALFYVTPVSPLAHWAGFLSPGHTYQFVLAVDDPDAVLNLWGLEHTAIAIGLMPVFLIACERVLAAEPGGRRGWTASAAISGMLVSWLHPWQGAILLAVIGTLFVLRAPRRRYLALALPVLATLAPLLYGLALSRTDASWHAFETASTASGTSPWWALLLSFGPLAGFAALGLRRPRTDRDWMLLAWIGACAAVYLVIPQFPPHALCGITLPLAVLAVSGWQRAMHRLHAPRRMSAGLALAGVLALTVPAVVQHFQGLSDGFANTISGAVSRSMYELTDDQAAAMRFLDRDPRPGAVLAPWLLSMSVPGFTDRPVYAGHLQWEPRGVLNQDFAFFGSALKDPSGATRRAILAASKARFVLAPCGMPSLAGALAPVARRVAQFGCVAVYETN